MTAAKDIEEIVAVLMGYIEVNKDCPRVHVANLISDWRKRGEARDIASAELDALGASHKDLAHRLARIGEELERERESHEVVLNSYAAENQQFFDRYEKAEAERDSARAMLRTVLAWFTNSNRDWASETFLRSRIAKELGPTREDEPHSPAKDNGEAR